jgi:hypothetical protein
MSKKILVILLGLLSTLSFSTMSYAEEIVVSGNGENSSNNATVNNNSSTTVNQENNANVDNNVNVEANTGGNDANSNTGGDVNIETGDASVSESISNNLNASFVDIGCCPTGGSSAQITGNGAGSNNTINYNQNSPTNITVNNNANVKNNVYGKANTGWNDANKNTGGSVSIKTGDITARERIKNSVNLSEIHASLGMTGDVSLKISGNGADSDNEINFNLDDSLTIVSNNSADIENNSNWDLNTGKNDANNNTGGDVSIETGDITFDSVIENNANVNIVDVDCCEAPAPEEEVPPGVTPPSSNPGSSVGGASTAKTDVLAAAAPLGDILPVTGGFWFLFLTLASITMLFLGWYLRLRSGRSPGYVIAA